MLPRKPSGHMTSPFSSSFSRMQEHGRVEHQVCKPPGKSDVQNWQHCYRIKAREWQSQFEHQQNEMNEPNYWLLLRKNRTRRRTRKWKDKQDVCHPVSFHKLQVMSMLQYQQTDEYYSVFQPDMYWHRPREDLFLCHPKKNCEHL